MMTTMPVIIIFTFTSWMLVVSVAVHAWMEIVPSSSSVSLSPRDGRHRQRCILQPIQHHNHNHQRQKQKQWTKQLSLQERTTSLAATYDNDENEEVRLSQQKLEEITATLAEEEQLLEGTEMKLVQIQDDNLDLSRKCSDETSVLSKLAQVLQKTQALLQTEMDTVQRGENQLRTAAETQRSWEDKYELEQNARRSNSADLRTVKTELATMQTKLTKAQFELSDVRQELDVTRTSLSDAAASLEDLERNNLRLRYLGKQLWTASANRVIQPIRKLSGLVSKKKKRGGEKSKR